MVAGAVPKRRFLTTAGLLAAAVALALSVVPGRAGAVGALDTAKPKPTPSKAATRPQPPKPAVITVAGKDPGRPIKINQADRQRAFDSLYQEIAWLGTADANSSPPAQDKLGPKFTITVYTKDNKMLQSFTVYPLASGGARAYRPANNPTGLRTSGWMYASFALASRLREVGADLDAKPDVVSGGIGGGVGTDIKVDEQSDDFGGYFSQFRSLFLLNGAVVVIVLFGLAGVAYLIRRKI